MQGRAVGELGDPASGALAGVSAPAGVDEKRPYKTIATGFTLVVLIMVLLAVFSIARLQDINGKLAVVVNKHNVATELAYEMHIAARERVLLLQAILLTEDPFDQDALVQRFHRAAFDVGVARKALLAMPLSTQASKLLAEQGQYIALAQPLQEDALALAVAGSADEAKRFLLKNVVPAQDRTLASLAKLLDLELEESRQAADASKREYRRAIGFVGAFGAFGVVLGILTGVYVFRKMKASMIKVAAVSGDLRKALVDLGYRQFAMDQHAIVSIADVAGNIRYVNDKFCEISQYGRDDLLGNNHRLLNSGHHAAEFFNEMWQIIASGKVWQGEVCNRNKLGGCYWVATTIVPFLDDDGLPYQYISIRTDITGLKEAQNELTQNALLLEQTVETRTKELAEREEVLSSIAGSANEAIIMIDSNGNVSYWNPAAETVFGYSAQEANGKYLHGMIVPARYLDAHKQAFGKFRAKGEGSLIGKTVEVEAVRKDGREFPLELSLSAVRIKGQWNAIGIARDVTERKNNELAMHHANAELKAMNAKLQDAQHQLLQSEKMASVGQLAAGVAHEINNPIGYVYSNIGTLEKQIADLLHVLAAYECADSAIVDNDVLSHIQTAKANADLEFLKEDLPALMSESKEGISRVRKIVQDLKEFSHVDSADEWQLTNLHQGLESTLNIASNEFKYKADVIKEYGDVPDIEGLPSQINQVFMNLLVNASHAIEERGTITLRSGCLEGEAWVEVQDTGKGIAPEHLKRIFDPFFTTKAVGKGTGLGLSLSYGIVQKHHGRIDVRSELGKGATFRVWFPVRQPNSQVER